MDEQPHLSGRSGFESLAAHVTKTTKDAQPPAGDRPAGYAAMNRVRKFRADDPELAVKIENRACPVCGMPPRVLCQAPDGSVAWYHVGRTGL